MMKDTIENATLQDVAVGDIVEVCQDEGHDLFFYQLIVTELDTEDGEIVGYGKGATTDDEALAEYFTHRIDASTFNGICEKKN